MSLNITALILAGGLGTRLRSVVADRPKVLAEVSGKPFIFRLLSSLRNQGILRAVLCTGYLADLVEQTCGEECEGVEILYSKEAEPLGTGGAIRLALPKLKTNETTLVLNGDSYVECDFGSYLDWHNQRQSDCSLLLRQCSDVSRYGKVELSEEGKVLSFSEKGRTGTGLINAGAYFVSSSLIEQIPENIACSLEKDIFPKWVKAPGIYGFVGQGRFIDIGTPDSYQQASSMFGVSE